MSPLETGLIGLAILFLLLAIRMPVGFTMALIGLAGFVYLVSAEGGLSMAARACWMNFSSYSLTVIPLFLLMGQFAFNSGISGRLYDSAHNWLGHMRGGLAMATVGACACFASISGSSMATAATMGTVALPEMKKYKYDLALATGSVAAGGSMGILIPPSVILIIYGIITEQSIGKLFLAGFIPGVMEAFFYMLVIAVLTKLNPSLGPRGPKTNFMEKLGALSKTWEVFVLFLVVIGGIYLGVFTPTEAAGIGAFGAFGFALVKRRLTWGVFKKSLSDTIRTTAAIKVSRVTFRI